jgi:pyruvate oxidase
MVNNCNFAEYAQNCGGVGIIVDDPEDEDLPAAVDRAFVINKPVIVDIDTDPRRFI